MRTKSLRNVVKKMVKSTNEQSFYSFSFYALFFALFFAMCVRALAYVSIL